MGCPPRTRMLATTVDFLKESGQVFLIMTGPPLRCHPCRLPANANIVFALPLRLNHFLRKSHSLRRIYARGAVLFCWKPSASVWTQVIGTSFSVSLNQGMGRYAQYLIIKPRYRKTAGA